jgi:hypothetical protein
MSMTGADFTAFFPKLAGITLHVLVSSQQSVLYLENLRLSACPACPVKLLSKFHRNHLTGVESLPR